MPKITLNERDNSNYADQQFIKIVYDGKISPATSGGAEKLDYTITFKSDNKDYQILSILNGQEVNAPVINPESVTEGYVFDAWTLDEEDIEFPIIPTSDLILMAKFKEAPVPEQRVDITCTSYVPAEFTCESKPFEQGMTVIFTIEDTDYDFTVDTVEDHDEGQKIKLSGSYPWMVVGNTYNVKYQV